MFWKKKKMVDIRELQRRGIVRIPRKDIEMPTDKEGFVELTANNKSLLEPSAKKSRTSLQSQNSGNFFGFLDNSSTSSNTGERDISESLRKISSQLSDLDNKLYKLEQRVELLERKVGVSSGVNW